MVDRTGRPLRQARHGGACPADNAMAAATFLTDNPRQGLALGGELLTWPFASATPTQYDECVLLRVSIALVVQIRGPR
jgi:hypothetical protein